MQHSVATHPPTTPVEAFVADVEQLLDARAHDADPDLLVRAVERRLTTLLASPDILEPEDRIPWADHYRPHLLTVAPSRRFSLLALIWAPGQVTPIHDHICWCVVGVLEGREREQRFSLRQNSDGQRWLATTTDVMVMPGEVSRLTPPEENIHQVRNAGGELAISLHVYGADISVCGSSVNQCFDELPIREDAATPHAAVSWRGS
jgi:3-mercaptopropionate dioxygenase